MNMSCIPSMVQYSAVSVSACMRVHMGLCVQYGDGKKRRKPKYSSVDLSEVEWEDKDDTVRHL